MFMKVIQAHSEDVSWSIEFDADGARIQRVVSTGHVGAMCPGILVLHIEWHMPVEFINQ